MSDTAYDNYLPLSKQPQEIKNALLELYRQERSFIRRDLKEKLAAGKDATAEIRKLKLVRRYIRRLSRKPSRAQR